MLTSAGALSVGNIGAPAISLNSICQLPAQTSNDLFAGGNISSGHGFATEWDGAGSRTVQMASGPNIAGNINAMLCGTTMYHYAAGDNGAMVRRAVNGMKQETNWSTVNTNVTSTIRAMWSYSDNFMMAVGDGGVILTSDGTTWTKMTSGTTANLRAIWGTSPINVLAVGENGTVLRYTP